MFKIARMLGILIVVPATSEQEQAEECPVAARGTQEGLQLVCRRKYFRR